MQKDSDNVKFWNNKNNTSYNQLGFTLIELIITLVIAAILVSMAIPNFISTISNNRLVTTTNEMLTAINLARSEAIKQGVQVTMRRNGGTSTRWEGGWNIFVDSDGNNTFNDDGDAALCETAGGAPSEDCLLRTYPPLFAGYTFRTGNSTYKDYITFNPNGLSTVIVGDTYRLCDSSNDIQASRSITINAIGRARVSLGTTSCP